MRLEVPFRRVGEVDLALLERLVEERLAPVFDAPGGALWDVIAARSQHIGQEAGRPVDVAFRKMRPTGYAQLCVVNDEDPMSPWARPLSDDVLPAHERGALVARFQRLSEQVYGDGVLHFLAFAVLAPGGHIPLHRDMPHDSNKKRHSHHLHVPITGAADADFVLHGATVTLEPGGIYEIDNVDWHSATNRGAGFRVNLMLDFCPSASLGAREEPSPPDDPQPNPSSSAPRDSRS